ncbi:MAG: class I SAM-dependent methyltransferase [Polyangiaceae bacterium]
MERGLGFDAYRVIAPVYDLLAHVYSGGAVRRCRAAFVSELKAGERALFAGAGTGGAAIEAARRGVLVVAVDLSPTMALRLRRQLTSLPNAEVVCADVFAVEGLGEFDWVFANFFLNVFSERALASSIERLAGFLHAGGQLVIGDFAAPARGWRGWLQAAYYFVPILVFWLATRNAFHRLHDYEQYFAGAGLARREVRFFRAFKAGPRWFASIKAGRA